MLKELGFGQDGVFSPEDFVERFNTDLCNDLGNLLNRTIGMLNKYFNGIVPEYKGHITEFDEILENFTLDKIKEVEKLMDEYHISQAISEVWSIVSRTNKYIDETMPWVLAKEENKEKLESVMYHLTENLRKIAILIKPLNSVARDFPNRPAKSISFG